MFDSFTEELKTPKQEEVPVPVKSMFSSFDADLATPPQQETSVPQKTMFSSFDQDLEPQPTGIATLPPEQQKAIGLDQDRALSLGPKTTSYSDYVAKVRKGAQEGLPGYKERFDSILKAKETERQAGASKGEADVTLQKTVPVQQQLQSTLSGTTFGLSDIAMEKAKRSMGIEEGLNQQHTAYGSTADAIVNGLGTLAGGLLTGKAISDKIPKMSGLKGFVLPTLGIATIQGVGNAISNLTIGRTDAKNAALDVGNNIVSALISRVAGLKIPAGKLNAVGQVATDFVYDLLSDGVIRGRIKEKGFGEWLATEIPMVVASIVGAGTDYADPKFKQQQKQFNTELTNLVKGRAASVSPEEMAREVEAAQRPQEAEPISPSPKNEGQAPSGVSIKLSSDFVNPEKISAVIDDVNNMGKVNPLNDKQTIINGVKVEMVPQGGKVQIKEISSQPVGTGAGSKVLSEIKRIADDNGVDIVVTPERIGVTSRERLVSWYKRNGFEEHTQGQLIYRAGKNKFTASSVPKTEKSSLEEIGDTLPARSSLSPTPNRVGQAPSATDATAPEALPARAVEAKAEQPIKKDGATISQEETKLANDYLAQRAAEPQRIESPIDVESASLEKQLTQRAEEGRTTQASESVKPPNLPPSTELVTEPTGQVTSIRNKVVDEQRVAMGLPAAEPVMRRTWADSVIKDADMEFAKNPNVGKELVAELESNPSKVLTDTQDAILLREQVDAQARYSKATRDVVEAWGNDAKVEAAQTAMKEARDNAFKIYEVGKKAGTANARALAARKMFMDEQYNIVEMENAVRANNKGKPLTEDQTAEISRIKKEFDATKAKLDEQIERVTKESAAKDEEIARAKAYSDFDEIVKSISKEPPKPHKFGKKYLDLADRLEAEAIASMKARSTRMSAGVDPSVIVDMVKLGTAYTIRGTVKFADWAGKMKSVFKDADDEQLRKTHETSMAAMEKARIEDLKGGLPKPAKGKKAKPTDEEPADLRLYIKELFKIEVKSGVRNLDTAIKNVHEAVKGEYPELTPEKVRDVFSDYGITKVPKKDFVSRTLSDFRRQSQLLASIERVAKELAPLKTGLQRDKPTPRQRELQRQLSKMMKEAGIETSDPATQLATAMSARKTHLENAIEDLDRAIKSKTRMVTNTDVVPMDAETMALKIRRDDLRTQYDAMFPKEPMSAEQKLARSIAATEKSITTLGEKIDMMKRGVPESVSGSQPWSKELSNLKMQQKKMQDNLTALRKAAKPTPDRDQMAIDRSIAATQRSLENINTEIKNRIAGTHEKQIKGKQAWSETISELKKEQADRRLLLKQLKDMEKPVRDPVQAAIDAKRKRLESATKEMQRRMATGDFSKKTRTETDISGDMDALKAQAENIKVRQEFNAMKEQVRLQNRTMSEVIKEGLATAAHTQKNLISSYDISAPGRQGGLFALTHPVMWAKAFTPMFKSMSQPQSMKLNAEIFARENAKNGVYKRSGLGVTKDDGTGNFMQIEDSHKIDLASKVPGVNASNRAYGTFLNKIRADLFDKLLAQSKNPKDLNDAKIKAIADGVNVLTGRGEIGRGAEAASLVLWAPRFLKSAFDVLTLKNVLRSGTRETQWMFAKEYIRALGTLALIYGTAALMKRKDDKIEWNPTSSDFGAIHIGSHSFNPIGFVKPLLTFMARTITGEMKTKDGIKKISPWGGMLTDNKKVQDSKIPYGGDYNQTLWRFLQSKSHPTVGTILSIFSGKNFAGDPITSRSGLWDLTPVPLSIKQTPEIIRTEDVDTASAYILLNYLGWGVQQDFEKKKKQNKEKELAWWEI